MVPCRAIKHYLYLFCPVTPFISWGGRARPQRVECRTSSISFGLFYFIAKYVLLLLLYVSCLFYEESPNLIMLP